MNDELQVPNKQSYTKENDTFVEKLDIATEERLQKSYEAYENGESIELNLKDKNWFKKLTS